MSIDLPSAVGGDRGLGLGSMKSLFMDFKSMYRERMLALEENDVLDESITGGGRAEELKVKSEKV